MSYLSGHWPCAVLQCIFVTIILSGFLLSESLVIGKKASALVCSWLALLSDSHKNHVKRMRYYYNGTSTKDEESRVLRER